MELTHTYLVSNIPKLSGVAADYKTLQCNRIQAIEFLLWFYSSPHFSESASWCQLRVYIIQPIIDNYWQYKQAFKKINAPIMNTKTILQNFMVLTLGAFFYSNAYSKQFVTESTYLSCIQEPEKQQSRSKELELLLQADQKERMDFENLSEDERVTLFKNDLIRRKRVGEILGEGCLQTSPDYVAASLIYQHGNVPDHFFQAFIWANRAVGLGDLKQTQLVALTIDRYLVSIRKKQLFGSQAYASEHTNGCYCLEPTERSFPDTRRKEYSGFSLQDRYDWLASINLGKNCPTLDCSTPLSPSPKGTVPGFW